MKTTPMLPIQGAEGSIQTTSARTRQRDRAYRRGGDYLLDKRVIDALEAARGRHPLVIRHAIPQEALPQIAAAWSDFIDEDEEEYDTNEGPKTDSDKGSSCRGPQRLKRVWDEPWRVETNLKKQNEPTTTKRARRSD